MLRIGMTAPDFELQTHSGLRFRLSDHAGRRTIVLMFLPSSGTWFGKRDLDDLALHVQSLSSYDAVCVGITDTPPDQLDFLAGNLGNALLLGSDDSLAICRSYRVLWLKSKAIRRVTYVVDRKRIIRGVAHHELLMDRHWKQVKRVLDQMKQEEEIATYNRKSQDL